MKKVGIVFGGKSPEHSVSVISAKAVYKNIDKNRYKTELIAITKDGEFYTGKDAFSFLENEKGEEVEKTDCSVFRKFDVIFPVLHGPFGEDGTIQGLLEFLGIPYVGCGVEASAVCMHKGLSRDMFKIAEIPQPHYVYFSKEQKTEAIEKVAKRFKFPVFVKPCRGGSSIGISKVKHKDMLEKAVNEAFNYDSEVIIEEGIEVLKEVEVAVFGNKNLIVSPPGGLIPGDEFYTYKDKYVETKTLFEIPTKLPNNLESIVKEYAQKAFKQVKGKGMARIDFFLDKAGENIFINEINTIPGFTEISMYPKLMALAGYNFTELISGLIELATEK